MKLNFTLHNTSRTILLAIFVCTFSSAYMPAKLSNNPYSISEKANYLNNCVTCNGTLSGTFFSDVIVSGGTCTLDGATITASVQVSGNGKLIAKGGSLIQGGIQVENGGKITLEDVMVLGDVSLKESGNVIINSNAAINGLKLEKSGNIVANGGNIGNIEAKESGSIKLTDSTVFPGGVSMEKGTTLVAKGATIEGSINVVENNGNISVQSSTTQVSILNGSISVGKGTGNVTVRDAIMASGDLGVVEQEGNVLVINGTLSDIKIEKIKGNVTLKQVTTDSDSQIGDNDGDIFINRSSFTGDVEIKLNKAVTVKNSSFSLEDISIIGNQGPILIRNNKELGLSVSENNAVTIEKNKVTSLEISKNTGGTTINNNSGEDLICSDNSPAPSGSGNDFEFTDGQCAGSSLSYAIIQPNNPTPGIGTVAQTDLKDLNGKDFILLQNYPNPFTSETTIGFVLAKPALVSLKVYDILGRRTEILAGQYQAGRHEIVWNAEKFVSGVYTLRLDVGGELMTNMMVLRK